MTEFASYPMSQFRSKVVEDLTADKVDYQFLTVHYVYVVVRKQKTQGRHSPARPGLCRSKPKKIGDIAMPALAVSPDYEP